MGTPKNDKGAQSSLSSSLGEKCRERLPSLNRSGISSAFSSLVQVPLRSTIPAPCPACVLGPLTRHSLPFSAPKEQRPGRDR